MAEHHAATPFRVPMIDLGSWWDGDHDQRRSVAEEFDLAARTVGFVQVLGHRIPAAVIDDMRCSTDAFFRRQVSRSSPPTEPGSP